MLVLVRTIICAKIWFRFQILCYPAPALTFPYQVLSVTSSPPLLSLTSIHMESKTLEFLISVKYQPSYSCMKFKRGFEMLISEMRDNDFVKSSDFSDFAAHTFISQLWSENKSCRGDPCGVTGFGIFKIRQLLAELWLFDLMGIWLFLSSYT